MVIVATKHATIRYAQRAHYFNTPLKVIKELLLDDFCHYWRVNGFRRIPVDDGKFAYITPGRRVFIVAECEERIHIITYIDCGNYEHRLSLKPQTFYNSWITGYFD